MASRVPVVAKFLDEEEGQFQSRSMIVIEHVWVLFGHRA